MADQQFFLLFCPLWKGILNKANAYGFATEDPSQEYDDGKFHQLFRLSKFFVMKLLDKVHCRTWYIMPTNIMGRFAIKWSVKRP